MIRIRIQEAPKRIRNTAFRTTKTTFYSIFYGLNWPAGHNEDILGILHSSDGPGSQKHLQENIIFEKINHIVFDFAVGNNYFRTKLKLKDITCLIYRPPNPWKKPKKQRTRHKKKH